MLQYDTTNAELCSTIFNKVAFMPKKLLTLILFVFLVYVVFSLIKVSQRSALNTTGKIQVTTSFYPLAEFTQHVGGNDVDVYNLTPPGAEPHDFEPTPQDLVKIQNSKLLIYNGAGLDLWVNKLSDDTKKNLILVNASKTILLLSSSGNSQDPHVWLDPLLAKQQVGNIKAALVEVDPDNSNYYELSAKSYSDQLDLLDAEFRKGLANCQSRDIVTSHNAFQYLGKRYNLNILSISGLSPDEEPSPKKLAEVTQFVKKNKVKYIFFETLVSPKLSQTITQETGAQAITFNPLEGLTTEELAHGKNYISVQRDNLTALRTALNCQ
jgi:zinc transport system substrate-binding protein